MVRAVIRTDDDGLLRSVNVTGHAQFAEHGKDIVCASITAITRSAARILELDKRIEIDGGAFSPGELFFEVKSFLSGSEEYIRGVTDFLVLGLGDVAREYPERCFIELNKEQFHGT